ncbi:MAG: hypothetical protein KGQ66_17175 [Acidobacteriota bacterium]|nr:hypothetical protein [Acidobacteriota bacterium]
MRLVRGEDDVIVTARRAFNDCYVDHVFVVGPTSQLADPARLVGGHLLDVTAGQHTRKTRLARPTPPRFSHHGSGDRRHYLLGDEADMKCPHATVVAIPGDQGSGVIGDSSH